MAFWPQRSEIIGPVNLEAHFVTVFAVGPDWAAVTTAIGTAIIAIFAVVAIFSLLDARKTRHGELIADLSRRWDEPEVLASIRLFREFGTTNTVKLIENLWGDTGGKANQVELADWYELSLWPNLIETIGVYWSEGVLAAPIVYRLWGGTIIKAAQEWKDPIARLRKLTGDHDVWQYFETLAKEMSALSHNPPPAKRPGRRHAWRWAYVHWRWKYFWS